jgi:sarcosine/dimethylglycine N-methyltransferase
MPDYDQPTSVAREYYNSDDAHTFYTTVWGGEDLHLGVYERPDEPIFDASRRAVDAIASLSTRLNDQAKVLDIGAGFGGTARHLAKTFGCHVTCLNLSEVENQRNRRMSEEQGVGHLIEVVDGSFQTLPFEDNHFDVVWSQDAILHSSDRRRVLEEVHRVLKPGGEFVFSDPMQADSCPEGVLDPILERIHLETLGSPGFYQQTAKDLGMKIVKVVDQTPNLTRHYGRVLEETEKAEPDLEGKISPEYLTRMKQGLRRWVEGGEQGWLSWCHFCFRK